MWFAFILSLFVISLRVICAQNITNGNRTYMTLDRKWKVNQPDVGRNISEIITSFGYPVERHYIITSDGYILLMHRMPPKKPTNKVVVCMHPLEGSSGAYVMNMPNQSLGFLLHDRGYDVWMGNARGNTYSRKHVRLNPENKEFWMFSVHDIATKDLPAAVDYILEKTGQKTLHYVGMSMGTTTLLILLSEKPEYNKKMRSVMLMAPVANVTYMTNSLRFVIPLGLDKKVGYGSVLASKELLDLLSSLLYEPCSDDVCLAFEVFGDVFGDGQNKSRYQTYMNIIPAGTSWATVLHYCQNNYFKRFQSYDWGKELNLLKYGQATPKEYNLENVSAKISIFWSLNDNFGDPVDIAIWSKKIKNLEFMYEVSDPLFTHYDFIISTKAAELVYGTLLNELDKY